MDPRFAGGLGVEAGALEGRLRWLAPRLPAGLGAGTGTGTSGGCISGVHTQLGVGEVAVEVSEVRECGTGADGSSLYEKQDGATYIMSFG